MSHYLPNQEEPEFSAYSSSHFYESAFQSDYPEEEEVEEPEMVGTEGEGDVDGEYNFDELPDYVRKFQESHPAAFDENAQSQSEEEAVVPEWRQKLDNLRRQTQSINSMISVRKEKLDLGVSDIGHSVGSLHNEIHRDIDR